MVINIGLYTTLIPVLITIAVALALFYAVSRNLRNIATAPSPLRITEYVTLRCPTCGYSKVREFRVGDYVGMVDAGEKCPNDGSNLVIVGIGKEQPELH